MKNTSQKKRILIIEDEDHIAEGIKLNLSLQGYEVEIAATGVEGIQKWKEVKPDLIILDIMLPGIDGYSVLQNIRLEDERLPILILSAKSTSADKIKGLTYGVDDYLTKPFELEELILRVERLLKQTSWYAAATDQSTNLNGVLSTYDFGGNHIDFVNCIAVCELGEIRLTEQEVKLLKVFIKNKGTPLSRDILLEVGWGYSKNFNTRTIDNFIVRLRKYFEKDPKNPQYFVSLRSVGYVFNG